MGWHLQANAALGVDVRVETTAATVGGDSIHARRLPRVICSRSKLEWEVTENFVPCTLTFVEFERKLCRISVTVTQKRVVDMPTSKKPNS